MPGRLKLSDEQTANIVALNKAGRNWLQIQEATGVPRQIAKREYEKWAETQTSTTSDGAREQVAAGSFRQHINFLLQVANTFPRRLRDYPIKDLFLTAEEFLNSALSSQIILVKQESANIYFGNPKLVQNQNRRLFRALVAHSEEKVNWEIFNKWKTDWDRRSELANKLISGSGDNQVSPVLEIIMNFIEQNTDSKKRLTISQDSLDNIDHFAKTTFLMAIDGKFDNKELKKDIVLSSKSHRYHLDYAKFSPYPISFESLELATILNSTWDKFFGNIAINFKTEIAEIRTVTETLSKEIDDLEEQLDPLVIEPVILRSHCELCPA